MYHYKSLSCAVVMLAVAPLASFLRAQPSYDFALATRVVGGAPNVTVWSGASLSGPFTPTASYAPSAGTVRAIDGDEDGRGRLFQLVENPTFPGGAYIIRDIGGPWFIGHSLLTWPPPVIPALNGDTWTDIKIDRSVPGSPSTLIAVGHDAQGNLTVTRLLTGVGPTRLVVAGTGVTAAFVAIDQSNGTIYVADNLSRLHTVPTSLTGSTWAPLLPAVVPSDIAFSPVPTPQSHPLVISANVGGGIHRYALNGQRGISVAGGAALSISVDDQGYIYAILDFGVPPNAVVRFDPMLNLGPFCNPGYCVIPSDYTAIAWLSRAMRDSYYNPPANLIGAMTLAQPSYVNDTQLAFNVSSTTTGMTLGVANGFVLNQPFGLHLDASMVTIPAPLGIPPFIQMVVPVNLTPALNGARLHWQLMGIINGQIQTSGMVSHVIGYRPVE